MKCPKCDKELQDDDIEDVHFRGGVVGHYVYICKKCDYIIGFGVLLAA